MKRWVIVLTIALSAFLISPSGKTQGDDERPSWQQLSTRNPFILIEQYEQGEITDLKANHYAGVLVAGYRQDFDLAFQRLKVAQDQANQVDDAGFATALLGLKAAMLLWTERYTEIVNAQDEFSSILPANQIDAFTYWAKIRSQVRIPKTPYTLKNIAKDDSRIEVLGRLNDVETRFIFDTGADSLLMGQRMSDRINANLSSITLTSETVNKRFSTRLGTVDSIEVGIARLENFPASVLNQELDEIWNYNGEFPDAVLGIREIRKLGETVKFSVSNDRVDEISIIPEKDIAREKKLSFNLILVGQKPIIKLALGDQIYSCLFDVGAPWSYISEEIFERHKRSLNLKTLKRKERRKRFGVDISKAIDGLPVDLGDNNPFTLRFVQVRKDVNSQCFIGIDAVLQAGGATMSIKQERIEFGPPV